MYNNNIIIKIRKLTPIYYYYRILISHSGFAKCSKISFRDMIQVRTNCVLPVLLMALGLECVLSFFVFYNLEAVDEKTGSMKSNLTGCSDY